MRTQSKRVRRWRLRSRQIELGGRTRLMGIVNVTPDSFSDGGSYLDPVRAADHALRLEDEGADILDIGAESSRPGSDPVSEEEQIKRLLPVFEKLIGRVALPVSVDTRSARVARTCLEVGASIVNDISAFRTDPDLSGVCREFEAGVVLMHMYGLPKTMQQEAHYDDLIREIHDCLRDAVHTACEAGIDKDAIVVDPGLGFGKSFDENHRLLAGLGDFSDLSAGVLAGPSRKAFTGQFSGLPADKRQYSTAAAVTIAVLSGADIIRVHDVKEMRQVTDIVDHFLEVHDTEFWAFDD